MTAGTREMEALVGLLGSTTPEGLPVFSRRELEDFVPLLLVTLQVPKVDALPAPLLEALEAACERMGLTELAPPSAWMARLTEHYAAHPPRPELVAALRNVLRAGARSPAGLSAHSDGFEDDDVS